MRLAAAFVCLGCTLSCSALAAVAAAPPEPAPLRGDWLGQAQRELARHEYRVSTTGQGLQAPNRAQRFRTYFDADGIRLVERDTTAAPLLSLRLRAVGRPQAMTAVAAGSVRHDGSRVEIARTNLLEWYENASDGLEQGFVLQQRPYGHGDLYLELVLRGARASGSGDSITLENGSRRLRYGNLVARDAQGTLLPATLHGENDRVVLRIADAAARYPLTIDPLITSVADAQLESAQANVVAAAGDVNGDGYADVILGAPYYDNGQTDEGAAFIYFGGPGTFDTTADAQLEANQASSAFGTSVASAGDVNGDGYADVIVGAPTFDNGQTDEGAAFVFFGGAGVFNTTADAQLECNQSFANFGGSVAGTGDVNGDGYADVIVGAAAYDYNLFNEGAAFLYFGGAGAFNLTVDAVIGSNVASYTGTKVDAAGDVNGDGYADVVVTESGAAKIYLGGSGAFDTASDATLATDQPAANLALLAARAGDVNGDGYSDIVISTAGYGSGGAAFIYFGGAGAFDTTFDAQLLPGQTGTHYGSSVAGAGDVNGDGYGDIIVGAYTYQNGQADEGAAFVYYGGPGAFDTTADAQPEGNLVSAQLGFSVAGAGDVNGDGYADVIVGVPGFNNGSAFIYFGSAAVFDLVTDGFLESNKGGAIFGASVAGAGDVNGDGYGDVIVGAPYYDNGKAFQGAAFIYFGGAGPLDSDADAHLEIDQASAFFGISVAGAGDVNGDGYADVIVGASGYANGQANEGAAFIYFGGPGAFDPVADAKLESNQSSAQAGRVAAAGDVNGDGYADVIVGVPFYSSQTQSEEGAAFVYFGGPGAFDLTADALLESEQSQSHMGTSVAGAGDVNGDGFADVIVGAPAYTNPEQDEGAAFVYFGGANPFQTRARLEISQPSAAFGSTVAGAGDLNGDGYADVAVGAPSYADGQSFEGAVFVYFGGSSFDLFADASLQSNVSSAQLGAALAGAGDLNGDGYADLLAGTSAGSSGVSNGARIYFGNAGFNSSAAPKIVPTDPAGNNGQYVTVAGLGDVNGDGFADAAVAVRNYDNGQADEGAVFVYYGQPAGRLVQAAQVDAAADPVDFWSLSGRVNGFTAAMQATSPRGRERARMELEACPPGKAFGSAFCSRYVSGSWTDIGANAAGITVSTTATGLTKGTLYHWRSRVLYAPFTVTQAGIVAPAKPMAGPWRRLQGNANVNDIRIGTDVIFADGFD